MKNYVKIPGTNRHLNPKIVKFGKYIIAILIATIILNIGYTAYTAFENTPDEVYDSMSRNVLKLKLNDRDPEAIEYYKDNFIARNDYIFNGPLTITLMAQQYGLNVEAMLHQYEYGDYESAQIFFETYVRDLVMQNNMRS